MSVIPSGDGDNPSVSQSLDAANDTNAPGLSELSERDKPWDKHRANTDKVERLYAGSEFQNYSDRVRFCSEFLDFRLVPEDDDLGILVNSVDLQNLDVSRLSGSKYARLFPDLVFSRSGSPETGGGTWLHPDLAIQLAQWCSAAFAIQVSRWVREWMTSAYNPVSLETDMERVAVRDELKGNRRLALTNQVKFFLEAVGQYNPGSKETGIFFAKVHDELNLVLTAEKASDMRLRAKLHQTTPAFSSAIPRSPFFLGLGLGVEDSTQNPSPCQKQL